MLLLRIKINLPPPPPRQNKIIAIKPLLSLAGQTPKSPSTDLVETNVQDIPHGFMSYLQTCKHKMCFQMTHTHTHTQIVESRIITYAHTRDL